MMNELIVKVLEPNISNIEQVEKLRIEAYHLNIENPNLYYTKNILEGNYLVFVCIYQKQIIGGAYISNSYNSLYVEQIFVKPSFQNHSLHIGHQLLQYILENKEISEKYFQTKFYYSKLESRGHDSFYEGLGYHPENNLLATFKKRI